jgi:hypothetical protein
VLSGNFAPRAISEAVCSGSPLLNSSRSDSVLLTVCDERVSAMFCLPDLASYLVRPHRSIVLRSSDLSSVRSIDSPITPITIMPTMTRSDLI